jgi:hypothetical protein
LIVRRTTAPSERFVLTCAHMLGTAALDETAQQLQNANVVYSPEFSECCDSDCNHPIGQVVNSTLETRPQAKAEIGTEVFAVDGALIKLTSDAEGSNEVPNIGR